MWLVLAADAERQRNKGEVQACGGDRYGPSVPWWSQSSSSKDTCPAQGIAYGLCRGHVLGPLLMRQKGCCGLGRPGQLGELWDPLVQCLQGWTLLAAISFGRALAWGGQEAP